jgi:G5 domain
MTAGTSALLIFIGGGAAAVATIAKTEPRIASAAGRETIATAVQPAAPVPPAAALTVGKTALGDADAVVDRRTSDEADRTATRGPRRTATGGRAGGAARGDVDAATQQAPAKAAAPAITTSTVTETRPIPYRTRLVRDPSLPRGSRRVETPGVPGEQTLRWLVTRIDGKETGRRLIDTTITRQPQHQVIAFGSQGRGGGHRHMRECEPGLHPCLPLGRSACPDQARAEESAVQLGGSLTVLDKDLALVDPDGLELDPGPCPTDGPA